MEQCGIMCEHVCLEGWHFNCEAQKCEKISTSMQLCNINSSRDKSTKSFNTANSVPTTTSAAFPLRFNTKEYLVEYNHATTLVTKIVEPNCALKSI